jgi:hypothetical protein
VTEALDFAPPKYIYVCSFRLYEYVNNQLSLECLYEKRTELTNHILDTQVLLNRFAMIASSSFKGLG